MKCRETRRYFLTKMYSPCPVHSELGRDGDFQSSKNKHCQHLLTFLLFQTCLTFIVPWNITRDVLMSLQAKDCFPNNKNHIMTTDSGSKTTVLFTEALPHLYVKQTKFYCKPLKPHPYAYFLT